jgi:hypothetical protein
VTGGGLEVVVWPETVSEEKEVWEAGVVTGREALPLQAAIASENNTRETIARRVLRFIFIFVLLSSRIQIPVSLFLNSRV